MNEELLKHIRKKHRNIQIRMKQVRRSLAGIKKDAGELVLLLDMLKKSRDGFMKALGLALGKKPLAAYAAYKSYRFFSTRRIDKRYLEDANIIDKPPAFANKTAPPAPSPIIIAGKLAHLLRTAELTDADRKLIQSIMER